MKVAREVSGEVVVEQGAEGLGVFVVCFSLRMEDSLPLRVMASVSCVSFLEVLFWTQQHGPSDLSHWHPVFLVRSEELSVKVSSHVTKILREVSMPAV